MLLNPHFRKKKYESIFGKDCRNKAIQQLKNKIDAMKEAELDEDIEKQPPVKKRKLNIAKSGELDVANIANDEDSDSDDEDMMIEHEWDNYYRSKLGNNLDMYHDNPMKFWVQQNSILQWPHLAKIAKSVFITQSSSAASESIFSFAGNILNHKRAQILPSNLSALTFIASYLRFESGK